jgi:hypothetical protein
VQISSVLPNYLHCRYQIQKRLHRRFTLNNPLFNPPSIRPSFFYTHFKGAAMTRLASRFGAVNLVRRDRPLTRDELAHYVPSVFSEEKHESRSDRYTYIPTITLLDNLQREGFQPFFACQTRVRDQSKREHTKHMLRLRREGQITGKQVPEIILLNSHDGSSSYQMLPGLFRAVCQNGLICGESFGKCACRIKAT